MKTLITLGALLTLSAQAAVTTTIAQLVAPEAGSANYEVLANNGRVYEIAPENEATLRALYEAKEKEAQVTLNIEEGVPFNPELVELVETAQLLDAQEESSGQESAILTPMDGYEPSNLESMELVNQMFKELKPRTKWFTQCYNRAHIWARQMDKDHGVKSQKILIYYTKKYREEVDKKWWFHIAPMVTVNGEKFVMDKEFTRKPVTDVDWESIFTKKMKSKNIGPTDYRCSKIVNIGEYYDETNTNNEYCNIQHVSMYYWNPVNLSALEKKGTTMTGWTNSLLKTAAKEIRWDWRDVYKEYKVQK